MLKKKRTWIILGIVAVVIGGGVLVATRTANSQTGTSRLLANAQQVKVVQTTLVTSVDSTGSIMPEAAVDLSFNASGTVAEVKVEVGDVVQQGDVLATLAATDLQHKVTQAEQSYQLQQLTYSSTLVPEASAVAIAQAAYDTALAADNAAQTDYANLGAKESVQCSQLTSAKTNLERAQTAYDRIANDHQASQYLNSDWGPFQNVVKDLANAQSAYEQAISNCNITKLNLNDSALRSAKAQLLSAKTALDNLTTPRTETQIQAAAALEQARLSLEQAKRNLAEATLTAPFDGLVTAVNIAAGGEGGSSAVRLADISQLHVDVLVDEAEIAKVKIGQEAQVTLDALNGITLTGTVNNINPTGTVSNGVVNYSVRVNLDPSDAALKLDMTANASLIGEKAENVLAVPTTAIRSGRALNSTNAQSGQTVSATASSMVMVLKDGQPRPVPVTVGMTTGDLTEVSGDLQAGDTVLVMTTTSTTNNNTQDFGPPDGAPLGGGAGGPPPDGGGGGPIGGPPPGG
jgi:HlyD family secretion protein